jgi:glycyl-tRNA synthetase beta chain
VQLAGEYPRLDLFGLITQANAGYAARVKGKWLDDTVPSVHKFLVQRLEWQLLSEGNKNELVSAVLGGAWKNPATVKRWLSVLQTVLSAPAGEDLLVVYRRVGRIVPDGFSGSLQPSAFTEPEERGLHQAWETARRDVTRASDEAAALTALARLRPAVDAFFGKVMVMVDDQAVQTNRLALVNAVRALFQPIADFSKISAAPAGKGREA